MASIYNRGQKNGDVSKGSMGLTSVHDQPMISMTSKVNEEAEKRAQEFMEKAGDCIDRLDVVCKEFGIENPYEVFGFHFDAEAKRYRLFIDLEKLWKCFEKGE